jgi:hypothetical protein
MSIYQSILGHNIYLYTYIYIYMHQTFLATRGQDPGYSLSITDVLRNMTQVICSYVIACLWVSVCVCAQERCRASPLKKRLFLQALHGMCIERANWPRGMACRQWIRQRNYLLSQHSVRLWPNLLYRLLYRCAMSFMTDLARDTSPGEWYIGFYILPLT